MDYLDFLEQLELVAEAIKDRRPLTLRYTGTKADGERYGYPYALFCRSPSGQDQDVVFLEFYQVTGAAGRPERLPSPKSLQFSMVFITQVHRERRFDIPYLTASYENPIVVVESL